MPNGGSDCCGTCWFNSNNEGEAGDHGAWKESTVKCVIRNIEIPNPFWTYCINHPHHNINKVEVPLGPVYVTAGYPYSREVWKAPLSNRKVRQDLLDLLNDMSPEATEGDRAVCEIDEEIIKHLRALKEIRALPLLLKIINSYISDNDSTQTITKDKAIIIGQAIEALLHISKGEYLKDVKQFIQAGTGDDYNQDTDNFSIVRYHLIRGLKYCPQPDADALLEMGTRDPHSEVQAFAIGILKRRKRRR